jgi:hypothetical protein
VNKGANNPNYRHGGAPKNAKTALYVCWANMIRRARKKGIKVCKRWHSFLNFKTDMGNLPRGHSIGRLLDGSVYQPGAAIWMTFDQQMAERKGHTAAVAYHERRPVCRSTRYNWKSQLAV